MDSSGAEATPLAVNVDAGSKEAVTGMDSSGAEAVPRSAAGTAAGTAATKTPTQKATQQEDKEVNQQTNIKTTSTITENGKGKTLTIVLRFPKDATMQSNGDGNTAQQLLMSFKSKGGRKKNKKNLTKKRHRKNT